MSTIVIEVINVVQNHINLLYLNQFKQKKYDRHVLLSQNVSFNNTKYIDFCERNANMNIFLLKKVNNM